jgi:amino acid transporter
MNMPSTRWEPFTQMAWLAGLMLAPGTLALHGNLVGIHRGLMAACLFMGAGMFALNAHGYWQLLRCAERMSDVDRLEWHRFPALLISLNGRIMTTVVGATALLVTAGFVFNEVFVYWFPNFAFAFILLGALVGLQLLGGRVPEISQIVFTSSAAAGMVVLISWGGLATPSSPPAFSADTAVTSGFRPVFLTLLLWVGFDLLFINTLPKSGDPSRKYRIAMAGLGAMTALFLLWAFVSLKYVAPQRLADTTIAHTLVAREILGQPGRLIIGMVAISGVLAAVNALFTASARLIRAHAREGLLPSMGGLPERRPWVIPVVLGGVCAGLMAGGFAGTEEIDTFLRAGLVLWMLHYATVHLVVLRLNMSAERPTGWISALARILVPLVGAGLPAAAASVLVVTDPERFSLLQCLACTGGGFFILGLMGAGKGRRQTHVPRSVAIYL